MEFSHRSVLLWECIEALNIRPDGVYLDGTLGGAGHSLEICRNLTTGRLIGVDRDPVALEAATKRLQSHLGKVTLVHDNFENIASVLERLGLDGVDGILLDLGVSSPQLDDGAQAVSLSVLMKYARTQFLQPTEKDLDALEEAAVARVAPEPVVAPATKKKRDAKLDSDCDDR